MQPSHHIEKLPALTFVVATSSFKYVPHSGKVDKIQLFRETSLIVFAILLPPFQVFLYAYRITLLETLNTTLYVNITYFMLIIIKIKFFQENKLFIVNVNAFLLSYN